MTVLSLLTDTELNRLALRLYRRIPQDRYGWDWRTLWASDPALANSFKTVIDEINNRNLVFHC